ncbi:MAG: glycosyltransferase family 39 protein [Acidobacteriota bacterium]|nr:glycosyltransferase family 39 protein [Acidobacteriota bacterium]
MRDLIRREIWFFAVATAAAVGLRLLFIYRFPGVTIDSFVYGDIAKNWLQHGVYGLSGPYEISPTYIRLPGYPAFLAAVFAIFGIEHYRAVLMVQLFVDVGTCFLIADITRRIISVRAAKAAFVLAALCPFLADYSAAALTETLEIFFTTLAFDCAIYGLETSDGRRISPWIGCGSSIGAAILLRPDGGLLVFTLLLYLSLLIIRRIQTQRSFSHLVYAGLIVIAISLAPLVAWGLRNQHTLHRFEPLAPRYANEPDEFVPMGFNRWMKTWVIDYASVEEIYWPVPGDKVDAAKLPERAFDSALQRSVTMHLWDDYNEVERVNPELDQRFAALANERIARAPLRYYLWLPAARIADMWFRPRTEKLPADSRWWEFNDDTKWSALAIALGLINFAYITGAFIALLGRRPRLYLSLLVTFVFVRSVFLSTLENPEPRYTLECYSVVIIVAAGLFSGKGQPPLAKGDRL